MAVDTETLEELVLSEVRELGIWCTPDRVWRQVRPLVPANVEAPSERRIATCLERLYRRGVVDRQGRTRTAWSYRAA